MSEEEIWAGQGRVDGNAGHAGLSEMQLEQPQVFCGGCIGRTACLLVKVGVVGTTTSTQGQPCWLIWGWGGLDQRRN